MIDFTKIEPDPDWVGKDYDYYPFFTKRRRAGQSKNVFKKKSIMNKYPWLNKPARIFLENGYLSDGETPEERLETIAKRAEEILGIKGFSSEFLHYASRGWFLLSSPVWANFGKKRGLPISCFNSHIEDSMDSILAGVAEVGMMTKHGGGTSGYFGDIRARGSDISTGGKSDGSVHFMQLFEGVANVCKQSSVRRGAVACYLPIDHGDIEEFLKVKQEGSPLQHIFTGVSVKDEWMKKMIEGDSDKRKVWAQLLKSRSETGLPYLFFYDNANNAAPQVYKDNNRKIQSSNLCNEIMLSSTKDESFVCCLSSMNLLHFDDWKKTDAVEIMALFLDAVLTEFIEKAENIPFMEKAVEFSKNQRAIGIGATGWHSLLQSKMIPFESMEAKMLTTEIFSTMNSQSLEASKKAAVKYGEPPLLKGYGERWTTRHAIAPNTSSAFVLGQVSQSIEPFKSNYYVKDLAKFKYSVRNKDLEKLLDKKGENTEEVWASILRNNGSVQQLECLDQHEKDVFRTFAEISAKEIVIQAAIRQKNIDQGQSLNLTIPPDATAKEINELMIFAWEQGIKGLYYQHSTNAAQAFYRKLNDCVNCEG